MNYNEFLAQKNKTIAPSGFDVGRKDVNNKLFDWQKDIVLWAIKKGKCAIFADCGLGKTIMQLEWARHVSTKTRGNVLIVAPLAVTAQTLEEGAMFGIDVNVCRAQSGIRDGISVTNYEMLEHFDVDKFTGVVLDESSILKHFGSRTRQRLVSMFGSTPYKLCCTATPSPNDYMELGNHAEFLGVMTRIEMLSEFFVHDGGDTSKWRLKGHGSRVFWAWVASWAASINSPRDLGYDGAGYELPELLTHNIVVESNDNETVDGQFLLFPQIRKTLNDRRFARKSSIHQRIARAVEVANKSDEQFVVWCDLNSESKLLSRDIVGAIEVAGCHTHEHKTSAMMGFTSGKVRVLVSKPSIAGWGMNWQNCHNVIFVGLSDSFEAYYQAVRRCWRYGQKQNVNVYIITSESEGAVLDNINRKQYNARVMMSELTSHTRDILYNDIHRTKRESHTYTAPLIMALPQFMKRTKV